MSPLSIRPKRESQECRVILDLSSPEGGSVNDWTPKDSYLGHTINLTYPSVDDLVERMYHLGEDCYMFKRDASHCFRWLPLDPFDYPLFGYIWQNLLCFDMVLAMGQDFSLHMSVGHVCPCIHS